ncbi:MAG: pyridoxamine 5'-phosphate oxidase family protein [Peptostreptococcaceae bacterium]|nr:pyridoxamine 5'-phosphate oxidase family protein [Peptostreptococcaceae bacterium]
MAREMRRKDRQVSEEKAWEMMRNAEWGTLSLASAGGEPYGVPVNFACNDKTIYIHCAKEGRKLDIIKENGRAAFCVVPLAETRPETFTTAYSSAMATGRICIAPEGDKRRALELLIEKYCAGLEKEGTAYIDKLYARTEVIKFVVESISGKSNI